MKFIFLNTPLNYEVRKIIVGYRFIFAF